MTDLVDLASAGAKSAYERHMLRALSLADRAASQGDVPVGALVVRGDHVLGEGYNVRERHGDPTGHAEVVAMRAAAKALGTWRLDDCVVVVTLEPCAMCAGAMVQARVAGCVFGCTDPKGGFAGTVGDLSDWPKLNHRFGVLGGVLEDACSNRLTTFFRRLRQGDAS